MERVLFTFPRNSDSTYQLLDTDELPLEPQGQRRLVLRRINPLGRPTHQSVMGPANVEQLVELLGAWSAGR